MFRRILKEQRGAFMVFFAILVPLFIGMIGFAVDAGFIYMQKAKMQDIADAAALAGAARLNDGEEREGNVASAVRAYAKANGLKITTATSDITIWNVNETNLDLTLGKKEDLKMGEVIQTGVTDKDGKQRDHVKVVIAKRVPTFFINVLFPDQKDGVVVKVAAAAEYVEGEEAPVSFSGARFMCSQYASEYINNKNTVVVPKGLDYSIYTTGSGFDRNKFPEGSIGTLYEGNQDHSGLPNGWNLVSTTLTIGDWSTEEQKKEYQAAREMENKYKKLLEEKEREGQSFNVEDFINKKGNKRYIGYVGEGENKKFINNIDNSDTKIDLYMNATDWENQWTREYQCFLTNHQIKNVKEIGNLILTKMANIGTNGITYGNIYGINGANIKIGGQNNYFKGTVYTNNNWDMPVGGINNHFVMGDYVSIITGGTLSIGKWEQLTERLENGVLKSIDITYLDHKNDSNWHIYFGGSSSGSSGSDDSGDETKAHVRLVE